MLAGESAWGRVNRVLLYGAGEEIAMTQMTGICCTCFTNCFWGLGVWLGFLGGFIHWRKPGLSVSWGDGVSEIFQTFSILS